MIHRIAIPASAIAAALLAIALPARAAELVRYDFSTGLEPTSIAPDIKASPVDCGAFNGNRSGKDRGRSSADGGNLFARVKSMGKDSPLILESTAEKAVAQGTFFTITLTGTHSTPIALESFSARIGAQSIGTKPVADYTVHYFLRSSADNFQSDLGKASHLKAHASRAKNLANAPWTVDLSALSIPADASLTFRIYVHVETDAPSLDQSVRLDDITFSGSSAQ